MTDNSKFTVTITSPYGNTATISKDCTEDPSNEEALDMCLAALVGLTYHPQGLCESAIALGVEKIESYALDREPV